MYLCICDRYLYVATSSIQFNTSFYCLSSGKSAFMMCERLFYGAIALDTEVS